MGAETKSSDKKKFPTRQGKLVVAISSRALFDLDESHQVYREHGEATYARYQIDHENTPLSSGVAFPLVKKLLALNAGSVTPSVEVILLSRNSADTGLRVFNSIRHHGLDITRAAFTRGESPYRYIEAFGAHLFLSADPDDVRGALAANIAAATILPSAAGANDNAQLRIAFDGDAVLFSDESERIYAENGLDAFNQSEMDSKVLTLVSCLAVLSSVYLFADGFILHDHGQGIQLTITFELCLDVLASALRQIRALQFSVGDHGGPAIGDEFLAALILFIAVFNCLLDFGFKRQGIQQFVGIQNMSIDFL